MKIGYWADQLAGDPLMRHAFAADDLEGSQDNDLEVKPEIVPVQVFS